MFDERFRAVLPVAAGPFARALVRRGVSPHLITVLAFGIAVVAAALVAAGYAVVGVVVWLVGRVADGLDGLVAREGGRISAFGAYIDITLDMAAYSVMVIGFAIASPEPRLAWLAILAAYTLAITSTLALSNAATALGRTISPTDRTFQFTTTLAEAGETSIMYALWALFPHWLPWLTWTWVAIVIVAVFARSRLAARVLR
jgi:phosphatidylglycerophosphate synthase